MPPLKQTGARYYGFIPIDGAAGQSRPARQADVGRDGGKGGPHHPEPAGRSDTTISAYMALLGSLSLNLRFAVPSRRSAIALLPSPDPNQPNKNPHAVELGRLGGKKGGRVRAERLI